MPTPDSPLRIVLLLGNAIVGGMETAVRRLLMRLPRTAFRVKVLVPFEGTFARTLRRDGHAVAVVPLREDSGWSSVHLVAAHVERSDAHLLHAHLPNAHMLAALAGPLTATPVLATIHTMHLSAADLEAHRLCDSDLVCVSETCAAHALGLGVSRHRVHVVRNAAPPPAVTRARGARRESIVAWIGRLSEEKDPETFVRAVARLADLPNVRFAIVGDGPLAAPLRETARELGVDSRIDWHGEVPNASAIVGTFDVVVSTSRHEGTPLVVLEALAAGVPVVATAVGGVPEIVANGENGLLVPSADVRAVEFALRRLCPSSTSWRPLPDGDDENRTRRFDQYVDETVSVLRTAAARKRGSPPYRAGVAARPGSLPSSFG